MKILILSNRIPYPLKDGGVKAIDQLLRGFVDQGHEVDLACFNTSKHHIDLNTLPSFYQNKINIHTVEIDTNTKPLGAIKALIKNESYHLSRFISKDFKQLLIHLFKDQSFDIIHIEGLFMCPYIDLISSLTKAKIALRSHNIEHQIWKKLALRAKGLKQWYLNKLWKQLKTFEDLQYTKVDFNIPIAEGDLDYIQQHQGQNTLCIPYGLNEIPDRKTKTFQAKIGFLGSLEWQPNIEGMEWFIDQCFPSISKTNKEVELIIAGRNTPCYISKINHPQINILGEIEDINDFYDEVDIVIVPLLSGSGMRIKVIEGMAYNKLIISTSIGAEGTLYQDGENIIIADDASTFIQKVNEAIQKFDEYITVTNNGYDHIKKEFNNIELIKKLISFYQS